ncbi:polysaccharide pyruvyl transferase family protein [Catenovulum sp. SM1970]|uniref:polysaccharide pyruvyl transferase family protein n=1 Tax=Marinifaba aquimaris TaxID=2741323 RepID=UPI0015747E72|nr:polysaccharide pyruvyl transferase family protein [Marinifaba aquimaris]NTS78908.1 polysaccharide pyruvyl transferase family protein [Marinifaba aquimaris]
MKLTYFSSKESNFGDELNAVMWQGLIEPDYFDDNAEELFLGIGSIIWDKYPDSAKKIVVGSGYGGYTQVPNVKDGSWDFCFVRGPRTAKALGIDAKLAITDAAILTHYLNLPKQEKKHKVSFMPHFKSIVRGNWQQTCQQAGIHFIDPRDDVESILREIQASEVLLTEAMHGAILADTLRTPWIAMEPILAKHRSKWFDWSESMELDLAFRPTPSSSLLDWHAHKTAKQLGRTVTKILGKTFSVSNQAFINKSAEQLVDTAKLPAQLSKESVFQIKAEQALAALATMPNIKLKV